MAKVIGIDLGTSNSAAAAMEGGRPVIIPSEKARGLLQVKLFLLMLLLLRMVSV